MESPTQIQRIAAKLLWWQKPSLSLARPARFLMQVMTLGTWRDVQTVGGIFGWESFREALVHAEPGVFDPRSWTYWHGRFGLPVPTLPQRSFRQSE